MCDKNGVEIKLRTEVTSEQILAEKPAAVVVATGGKPLIPRLESVNGKNIVTSLDVLSGAAAPGNNVLIVGGGMVG